MLPTFDVNNKDNVIADRFAISHFDANPVKFVRDMASSSFPLYYLH